MLIERKYRIVTDGLTFRIQKRAEPNWFLTFWYRGEEWRWKDMGRINPETLRWVVTDYKTKDEAVSVKQSLETEDMTRHPWREVNFRVEIPPEEDRAICVICGKISDSVNKGSWACPDCDAKIDNEFKLQEGSHVGDLTKPGG